MKELEKNIARLKDIKNNDEKVKHIFKFPAAVLFTDFYVLFFLYRCWTIPHLHTMCSEFSDTVWKVSTSVTIMDGMYSNNSRFGWSASAYLMKLKKKKKKKKKKTLTNKNHLLSIDKCISPTRFC